MFGKGIIAIFLSIFALCTVEKTAAESKKTYLDPNEICTLLFDGAKIVDDNNCAGYYTCNEGEATAATCSSGLYFNKDKQACLPISEVSCKNPCADVKETKFVSMAGSCSGYHYCVNKTVIVSASCSNGLIFDEENQLCAYLSDENCPDDAESVTQDDLELLCTYIPNGVFFGSPEDCSMWNKCTSNKGKAGVCTELAFDVQTQSCFKNSTSNCQQVKEDGENGGNSESGGGDEKLEGTGCENLDKFKPLQCSSYLKCNESNIYVKNSCAAGYYFDTIDKVCKPRLEAVNDCDRCEGTTLTFVNRPNDNCKGYYYCVNGKKSNKCGAVCSNDNYFDEKLGSCVKKSVEYKSCLESSYDSSVQCSPE